MILVWAPYPAPHVTGNGWMRRIAAVDALFAERERCYVYPSPAGADYRPAIRQVDARTATFPIDFRLTGHRRKFLDLLSACDFLYAHTLHSPQFLLPYLRTGKIIIDSHGLAPEEAALQGRAQVAALYAELERAALEQCAAVVVVTRAMEQHYRAKYPGLQTRFILMPIHNEIAAAQRLERPPRERPVVIYAGGAQRWQNVPAMMEAAARARDRFEFRFLTDELDRMQTAAREAGAVGVSIRYCPPDQLAGEYADADFGFVLRDDIAVNRVACPTKLFEYIAHGVIPIMTLQRLGDFIEMGGRCIGLDAFLAGRLPDAAELAEIRRANRLAFREHCRRVQAGKEEIAGMARIAPRFDLLEHRTLFFTDQERTALYPGFARYALEVHDGDHIAVSEGVCEDLSGPDARIIIDVPNGLRRLHVRPLAGVGFMARPRGAKVLLADGSQREVAVDGPRHADAWGNWRFEQPTDRLCLNADGLGAEVRRVEFQLDVLATSGELPGALSSGEAVASTASSAAAQLGIRGLSALLARQVWNRMRRSVQRPASKADGAEPQ